MPIYKQITEITNIDDLLSSVERDIEEVYFGDKQVFTVWAVYEGTLPATINANGADMRQYQIYGNTGGVGDRTVQLFDPNADDPDNGYVYGKGLTSTGDYENFSQANISEFISITPFSSYTFTYGSQYNEVYAALYNSQKEFVRSIKYGGRRVITFSSQDESYLRFTYFRANKSAAYVIKGSTPPASFVPFGYEVDMVIRDTTTINIGNEPLCGIGTYTDSLDLSTGILTRRIKKFVLTGRENWQGSDNTASKYFSGISNYKVESGVTCMSTHYSGTNNVASGDPIPNNSACFFIESALRNFYLKGSEPITLADFKSYLAAQYAAGTPVTVWYVLAQPQVSTITVPSGLTGTLEGYLIQDGIPTPETPIYPTANGVKQADGTYSIEYITSSTTTPIYIGDEPLDKDEYIDYQAGKIFRYETEIKKDVSQTGWQWRWETDNVTYQATLSNRVSVGRFYPEETKEYIISAVPDTFEVAVISADESDVKTADTGWGASWTLSGASAHSFCVTVRKSDNANITPSEVDGIKFKVTSLTPTNPPVTLPALPTVDGVTIVDYAGSGTVPEKAILKYRKKNF